jgi:iron complex outermembrane receptor protein
MIRNVFVCVLVLFSVSLFSQHRVSGKVTDEKGDPLIGANVVFVESAKGVITSQTGEFIMNDVPPGKYTLLVSYLGFEEQKQQIEVSGNVTFDFVMQPSVIQGEEIIVRSTRAGKTTPTTFTEVNREAIEANNLGQDMPFLFSMEPSVVTTSDAGAGIGYTGLWIRGSNIQRINVTVNGIPLNDPESHGVFFVNMPDFASSVQSAQIQRGVGTSTNGGGAFGATINLETNLVEEKAFAEINSSAGSFNTFKNNLRIGTGLINNKWAFEGRLSKISSDGYVDRASSNLKSFFVQGGYYGDNTTIKAVIFSGQEKTYQAWWGVDDWTIDNLGRTYNWAGAIYNEDGTTSFYDNQTDNYQQDHYQLHVAHKLTKELSFNFSGHYTYGRGYYEEYNQGSYLSDYPIGIQYFARDSLLADGNYEYFFRDSVEYADLITRRWLDNHFYGATYSLNYSRNKFDIILGGAFNKYANARHFGEIIWAQYAGGTGIQEPYYDNTSNKSDFNTYLKTTYILIPGLSLFLDMQYRWVDYKANGIDNGGAQIDIDKTYNFFNPKVGLSYGLPFGMMYASFAIAHREPIRTDFLDAPEGINPEPEKLNNLELGIRKSNQSYFYNANVYYMKYTNQLVLTGAINDVGSPIRENVGESSRYGIELDAGANATNWFTLRANASIGSTTTDFKRLEDTLIVSYDNVQLSYSPQAILGAELIFKAVKNLELAAITKYVSKQYLDLTQNESRKLDAYTSTNFRLGYSIYTESVKEIRITFLVNNVFNSLYSANGYTWGDTPYYYPQAGINFLAGISLRF